MFVWIQKFTTEPDASLRRERARVGNEAASSYETEHVCHRGSSKCRTWSLLGSNPVNLTVISNIRRVIVVSSWVIFNTTWLIFHFPM